ncbi:hypothetical protein [Comamonas sp. JC664]|uniref:hypothetical protein n=1 Tax=Comamonas sp. JC664 TaxID=2801917 RepID=UPI00174D022B|nr:hypothetical protein [Comamonas sp. JC664]MBL0694587.1 hypothetical protein [Comamonas sp. JC664]GHG96105.1 hypothetical protein GCM10012319_60300 [Comamonas sp. KCTC 72670]
MATHKVGGEVDALCTRCKLTLAHTILAMVGTKIARVRCNTCGGDHAYRGAPGVTDRPSSSSTTRTARASSSSSPSKAEKIIISFEEQLAGKDVASAPRYSPKDTYRVDQVIQHPTFGTGFVTAVRGDKVDITFRGDTKTLVHGRGGAPAEKPVFSPPVRQTTGPADKPQPVSEDAEQLPIPSDEELFPSSGD